MAYRSIVSAADNGDRLATLKALRHKLAVQIRDCKSGRDLAALSKQLREVLEEISTMEETEVRETATVLSIVRAKHETGA